MRRTFLGLLVALCVTAGFALPVSASVQVDISIDCDDGDSIPLTVDLDGLSALTAAVQAINDNPAGLSCTLTQLTAPTTVVTFGNVAAAAREPSGPYVIGGGTIQVGCTDDTSVLFTGSFAVKMYYREGKLSGSGNLKVGDGQCVAAGQLWSTPTCLVVVPNSLGPTRAWANSVVTRTSGPFFGPHLGKTIGWAFEDNGPNGGTLQKDRFRVVERPGSCPVPGDPTFDFYTLVKGDIAVRP